VESLTKGGLPSVSAKKLKEYKDEPAVQAFLAFSKADKLQSTYCDSLAKKFVKVGNKLWMPVGINPLAAKTGRRASSSPNFQNWPVSVRQIIVSRFQGGSIADNDYSKLEPILGGWVTGEPRLTEYFVKYPNGYIKIGEDFFKKTVEKNTKEYTVVKSLILGIIYNKKKWSLAEELWIGGTKFDSNYDKHTDKIGELLERFLRELFPGVKKYHAEQEELVLSAGKVYNALGQCRRLPLPEEPPRSEKGAYRIWMRFKSHVINQAINYPIQSLASYVTGCGLVDLERAVLSNWNLKYVEYQTALMEKCWPHIPLLSIEVHDDLVMDIPKGKEKKTKEITHDIMCKPPSLFAVLPELWDSNVKLSVDTNMGPCWGMKT
jgi:DNA polymerase I-like protein with 3'-5' exonuclease and polymerase domains